MSLLLLVYVHRCYSFLKIMLVLTIVLAIVIYTCSNHKLLMCFIYGWSYNNHVYLMNKRDLDTV